ncbi:MAG: hypothetical protein GWN24_03985 [Nitrospinaceae bacterium]|nr:hypothetical protein [Nitrospinaceae bacterium]
MAVLLGLVLAAGATTVWSLYAPQVKALKAKDPDRFAALVKQIRSFHFLEALRIHDELQEMTAEEVLLLRYRKLKEQWHEDPEFRFEAWEGELQDRARTREKKKRQYREERTRIEKARTRRKEQTLEEAWKKAGAWTQGLLLREKCIQYLKQERRELRRRRNALELSRPAALTGKPVPSMQPVPDLCEDLVPLSHDPQAVRASVERLKNHLNYFYFVRLLDDLGLPRKEVFPFPSRLNRMTTGFTDS